MRLVTYPKLTAEAVASLLDAYLEMREMAVTDDLPAAIVVSRPRRAVADSRCDVGSDIPGGGAA